ncbi:alpha/beta fold hydrolase [Cohnella sp. GCM10027633]|uniref:alpha/beta fold hydrolase n=1 Tax=unclassified Cohnella TaxID=2636738 RepID=UPI0036459DAD
MGRAFVNGIHLRYESEGEGFPIVAITGKDGSMDWWHPAIKSALSAGNRLIMLDNRGTGGSDRPAEPYGIADMAKDVVGLFNVLGIDKAHLLGQSMGGMIAQEIAIEHPERVEKLILCSTTCGVRRALPTFRMIRWLARKPAEFDSRAALAMLFSDAYIRDNPEEIADLVERMSGSPPGAATMAMHKQASASFDSFDRLGRIEAPTLIIHGEDDWVFRPKHAEMLHKRIFNSRLVTYPRAGHGVLSQERLKALEEIRRFID